MAGGLQLVDPLDDYLVASRSSTGPHFIQKALQINNFWFSGRVVDNRRSLSKDGSHENIFCGPTLGISRSTKVPRS